MTLTEKIKIEIFDIMAAQDNLQNQFNQLEQLKRQKVTELQAAQQEDKK